MKIKKGDQVLIISGKDKRKKSKVLYVFPDKEKIMAEGINLRKKHAKPKKEGEKGQIIEIPSPIHISNVKLICSKCSKGVRVEYKIIKDKKNRICKKCKGIIS
ncbi:MAG TPA: 50S ribosomal protein L24 [bacterium]|nr:50S ribosomal protein L24 [bacterium]